MKWISRRKKMKEIEESKMTNKSLVYQEGSEIIKRNLGLFILMAITLMVIKVVSDELSEIKSIMNLMCCLLLMQGWSYYLFSMAFNSRFKLTKINTIFLLVFGIAYIAITIDFFQKFVQLGTLGIALLVLLIVVRKMKE